MLHVRVMRRLTYAAAGVLLVAGLGLAGGQPSKNGPNADVKTGKPDSKQPAAASTGTQPFGANIFKGSFQRQVADGRNPSYVVMPGDRVAVNTWGTISINRVFVVDGQGNIFLPGIGPVKLGGVPNAQLTSRVTAAISKVYRRGFGAYTNLLTAAPVGVYVTGGVVRPGRYAGVPADSVLFFLDQAGGISPQIGSYRDIVVLRNNKPFAKVDLYGFVLSGVLPKFQFADGDTILVKRRGSVVEVKGKVAAPALVEFTGAKATGAEILRVVPKSATATTVAMRGVRNGRSFHQTLTARKFAKVEVRNGDTIEFRDDAVADTILVNLVGEFKGPSLLSVHRGSRLVDVLNYIVVDPRLSDVRSVHLRRESVARAQKKSINDALVRLERSALLALSSTEREAQIRVQEAKLMQNFIKSARSIQPLGRVVTSSRGRQMNLLLQDGDTIVIPPKTNVVRVGGEVQMAQAVMYAPGRRVGNYVRMAGGYTNRSDQHKVLLMRANASVRIARSSTLVRPGDEILILPKVDSKALQNAADVVQVIYQIAVAAAVVLAI